MPKVHQKEKFSLSDAEVKRILQVAKVYCNNPKTKNKNIFTLINLALVSGLRRGELLALTWDNIDFSTGRIYVANSVCELKDKIFQQEVLFFRIQTIKINRKLRAIFAASTEKFYRWQE